MSKARQILDRGLLAMALVKCPNCQGRNPSSAKSCVHCGYIAAMCQECKGAGICPQCEAEPAPGFPPCSNCQGAGLCPGCKGNKVRWPN